MSVCLSVVCLIKHHIAHTYAGVEVQLRGLLTSAECGGEFSASCLGRTPRLNNNLLN